MSALRSPRFQLLHISHRASHTNVQWKMSTVGWIGFSFEQDERIGEVAGHACGRPRKYRSLKPPVDTLFIVPRTRPG